MKTIFITVHQIIDQGGISRSIQNFLNEINEHYDVTLCALYNYISPNVFLPQNIKILPGSRLIGESILNRKLLNLGVLGQFRMLLTRILRRIYGMPYIVEHGIRRMTIPDVEYDVAIAFSGNRYDKHGFICDGGDYNLILDRIKAKKKVAWIHNDLRKEGFTHDICIRVFENFDAIVSVSYENKSLVDELVPEYKNKSVVIYNTYNLQQIKEYSKAGGNPYNDNGKFHFVTVARLSMHQKRQDRIIKACELLKQDGYDNFDWYLVGDGDREFFEKMASERHVNDLVKFVGIKTNPYPYYLHADAFVLTSAYEGFGMTIKEAQILGCPTLVTNFGPAKEAVKDGFEGVICENSTNGVYKMIKNILSHPEKLQKYREYLKTHPITNEMALDQFKQTCKL